MNFMNKKIYITDLPGYFTKEIEEMFFIKEAVLKESSNKKKFINLILQDKTGTICGIMWEEYIKEDVVKYKGCVVQIKGMVIQNQKEQYEILATNVETVEVYEQGEFVNGLTHEDTVKYIQYLHNYVECVKEEGYNLLLHNIFSKEEKIFALLPITLKGHHNYNGGLLVHTISVTSLVKYMSRTLSFYNFHPSYNIPYSTDLLVTASLLHAVGIVRMLTPFPELERINTSRLLSLYEHTVQYLHESFHELKGEILSEEKKALLLHTIACVYTSTELKPMLREALLLKEAYQLLVNVTNLEYFMNCHSEEEGCVFDGLLNNYLYIAPRKKEMLNE